MKNKICFSIVFSISLLCNSTYIMPIRAPAVIKIALEINPASTNTEWSEQAYDFRLKAFQKVKEGNYKESLEIIVHALQEYPHHFGLQTDLATLLGDYSSHFESPFKEQMIAKSQEIFQKLMVESKTQPPQKMYSFKNEYYYRFGQFKKQYELGLERVATNWNTPDWQTVGAWGYYSQGVGAANYAKELLIKGDRATALVYAQKALMAWAQFFSYDNGYYNAYAHYALALGILGYKDEMERALHRGASIIKKDHVEFQEVREFIARAEENGWI